MPEELKKDASAANLVEEINEEFDSFESWIMDNWRLIAAVCVGIVVAVAAIGIGSAVKKSMDRKVAQTFASADSFEKLTAVLAAHPSSEFAPEARMKLGMLQIEKKSYAEAVASFKAVSEAAAGATDELRNRAALNAGYALELQEKYDDAIAAFSAVGQNALVPEDVRAEANYSAGRLCARKGDNDKAKSLLAKANSARPRSMSEYFWSTQAKILLDRISASAKPKA